MLPGSKSEIRSAVTSPIRNITINNFGTLSYNQTATLTFFNGAIVNRIGKKCYIVNYFLGGLLIFNGPANYIINGTGKISNNGTTVIALQVQSSLFLLIF